MDKKSEFKVVSLYKESLVNIPAMLRRTADDIEAGEYGAVGEAAFVLMGETVEVFGWGELRDPTSTALLLHAAFLRLSQALERHGRE